MEEEINNYDNRLVLDNLDKLNELVVFLMNIVGNIIDKEICLDINKLTRMDINEKKKIINDFFRLLKIDFKLDTLINNGTILVENIKVNEDDDLYDALTGFTYLDEFDNKHIDVNDTNYLIDSKVWIHEIFHYLNLLDVNEVRDLLTEVLSFTMELIYLDYLNNLGYNYEGAFFKFEILENFNNYFEDSLSLIRIFLLYSKYQNVSEELYIKEFEDDNYEPIIHRFKNIIDNELDSLDDNFRYPIACALSIYMYERYKQDNRHIETIMKFNEELNSKSVEECLNIIGIKSFNDIKIALDIKEIEQSNIISFYDSGDEAWTR